MDWIKGIIPLCLLGLLGTVTHGQVETSQERLQELCARYKFLWSDADPSVFYYCFTNKAAVQLKCRTGYYMCKREGEPFHPCDCKFDGSLDEEPDQTEVKQGEFPSNGCPDPFLRYTNFHRFGGLENDATSLGECQLTCMQAEECIGVDWSTGESKCYILPESAKRFALSQKANVTHYMRTSCQLNEDNEPTVMVQDEETESISNGGGARVPGLENLPFGGNAANQGKQFPSFTTTQTVAGVTFTVAGGATTAAPTAAPTTCPTVATVPDSGCPFSLEKFAMMSHPFGKNITTATVNNNENDCKFWCVIRPYCMGVDFDSSLNTCYWFQEIQAALRAAAANVNHFAKTICGRPLMCWSITGSGNADSLVAITNIATPQVQCNGLCFLRQSVGTTTPTIERGCQNVTGTSTAPSVGCSLDGTSLLTAICYCDTDRCNGLSLGALSSMILYLPLNGDFTDHSGYNRFAVTSNGYNTPTFSCLDRSSNCSSLFTGSQCIEVRQMTQTAWGPVDATGAVSPQISLSVAFKRLPDGSNSEEGIVGNSASSAVNPSIAIVGRTNEDIVRAGIDSTTAPTGLNDFMRGSAPANAWNIAVLTYDGRDILALDLPITRFYINAVRQSGNEQADMGEVQIRAQPVTVGCVQGSNFTGFIDEVRIFNSVLQANDVLALNIMRDALYM